MKSLYESILDDEDVLISDVKKTTNPFVMINNLVNNSNSIKTDVKTQMEIKRIFNEYINGVGFDAIARNLYNDNIPSPSQVAGIENASPKWHGSSVRCILENPHFIGDLVQGRSTTKSVTSTKRNIVSNDDLPSIIVPSNGILSPGFITMQSPTITDSGLTHFSSK